MRLICIPMLLLNHKPDLEKNTKWSAAPVLWIFNIIISIRFLLHCAHIIGSILGNHILQTMYDTKYLHSLIRYPTYVKSVCPKDGQYTRYGDLIAQRPIPSELIPHQDTYDGIASLYGAKRHFAASLPLVGYQSRMYWNMSTGVCPNGGQYTRYGDLIAQRTITSELIPHQDTYDGIASLYGVKQHFAASLSLIDIIAECIRPWALLYVPMVANILDMVIW